MAIYTYNGAVIYEGSNDDDEFRLWNALNAVNVYGRMGNDYAVGDIYNDALNGFSGNDYLYGGGGNDFVSGDSGNDVLSGNIDGGPGNIVDDLVSDTVYGGTGNDIIHAASFDFAYGGVDNDTYHVIARADGLPTLVEFAGEGIDTVSVTGNASDPILNYTLAANLEILSIFDNVHNVSGNELDNIIFGNGLDNVIDAGMGNDSVYAGGGNDTVYGGTSADLLYGGTGNDQLFGLDSDDQLIGDAGNDTMSGGAGQDFYFVQDAGDVVIEEANEGIDEVYSSVDFLLPDNVENLFLIDGAISGTGNAGDNALIGNAQNNLLAGGAGVDFLNGQDGADTLIGGSGRDGLMGGAGADLFRYTNPAEASTNVTLGQDLIYDFVRGEDHVQFDGAAFGFTSIVDGVNFFTNNDRPPPGFNEPFLLYQAINGSYFLSYHTANSGPFPARIAEFLGAPQLTASDFQVF